MSDSESVLDRLLEATEDEIRRELDAVRFRRERLELEEQVLSGILDLVRSQGVVEVGRTAKATDNGSSADVLFTSSDGSTAIAAEVKAGGSKRGLILEIMATEPGRTWTAADIRKALLARGVEIRQENVRVTLRRMSLAGDLVRPGQGKFRLRPTAEATS